jgi:uncharacterized membrane protein YfcA
MPLLIVAFLVTALAYASVGFGGGSTYNALLVLADVDYRVLPSIALLCNLIVVTGGTIRAIRARLLDASLVLPFTLLSVPMAVIGGRLPVSRGAFVLLLGAALLIAGLAMLLESRAGERHLAGRTPNTWLVGLPTGAILGLLAGIVGIGGGIFLAPVLHLLRATDPRRISATASVFIMVNSIGGLVGQASKQGGMLHLEAISAYLPLFIAVFVGGQVGSHLGFSLLSPRVLRRLTAVLVIYVAARLLYTWIRLLTG